MKKRAKFKCGKWVKFEGDYEKAFYEIRLKSGEQISHHCWPNAGTFHFTTGPIYRVISFDEVTHVKKVQEA